MALNICEIKWLMKFHLTMNSGAHERKITFIVHLQGWVLANIMQ